MPRTMHSLYCYKPNDTQTQSKAITATVLGEMASSACIQYKGLVLCPVRERDCVVCLSCVRSSAVCPLPSVDTTLKPRTQGCWDTRCWPLGRNTERRRWRANANEHPSLLSPRSPPQILAQHRPEELLWPGLRSGSRVNMQQEFPLSLIPNNHAPPHTLTFNNIDNRANPL